jgi:hypothetical protein
MTVRDENDHQLIAHDISNGGELSKEPFGTKISSLYNFRSI